MSDKLISIKEARARTGRSLEQLRSLSRQRLLRIVRINQRVFCIPEDDLIGLADRIIEQNRADALATVNNRSGLDRETHEGLKKIFGYVPGIN